MTFFAIHQKVNKNLSWLTPSELTMMMVSLDDWLKIVQEKGFITKVGGLWQIHNYPSHRDRFIGGGKKGPLDAPIEKWARIANKGFLLHD